MVKKTYLEELNDIGVDVIKENSNLKNDVKKHIFDYIEEEKEKESGKVLKSNLKSNIGNYFNRYMDGIKRMEFLRYLSEQDSFNRMEFEDRLFQQYLEDCKRYEKYLKSENGSIIKTDAEKEEFLQLYERLNVGKYLSESDVKNLEYVFPSINKKPSTFSDYLQNNYLSKDNYDFLIKLYPNEHNVFETSLTKKANDFRKQTNNTSMKIDEAKGYVCYSSFFKGATKENALNFTLKTMKLASAVYNPIGFCLRASIKYGLENTKFGKSIKSKISHNANKFVNSKLFQEKYKQVANYAKEHKNIARFGIACAVVGGITVAYLSNDNFQEFVLDVANVVKNTPETLSSLIENVDLSGVSDSLVGNYNDFHHSIVEKIEGVHAATTGVDSGFDTGTSSIAETAKPDATVAATEVAKPDATVTATEVAKPDVSNIYHVKSGDCFEKIGEKMGYKGEELQKFVNAAMIKNNVLDAIHLQADANIKLPTIEEINLQSHHHLDGLTYNREEFLAKQSERTNAALKDYLANDSKMVDVVQKAQDDLAKSMAIADGTSYVDSYENKNNILSSVVEPINMSETASILNKPIDISYSLESDKINNLASELANNAVNSGLFENYNKVDIQATLAQQIKFDISQIQSSGGGSTSIAELLNGKELTLSNGDSLKLDDLVNPNGVENAIANNGSVRKPKL